MNAPGRFLSICEKASAPPDWAHVLDVAFAHDLAGHALGELGSHGIVDGHRHVTLEDDLSSRPEERRSPFRDRPHPGMRLAAHRLAERANGADERHFLRDDVERFACT